MRTAATVSRTSSQRKCRGSLQAGKFGFMAIQMLPGRRRKGSAPASVYKLELQPAALDGGSASLKA